MNELATVQARIPIPRDAPCTSDQWRILCDAIFPSAKTAGAIMLAWDYCSVRRLDIFKKPVNIVQVWNSSLGRMVETVWPGINELLVTAARTGKWAGMDMPEWGDATTTVFKGVVRDGNGWKEKEAKVTYRDSCSVTVYRITEGERYSYTVPVFWEEAYARQGNKDSELPTDMWRKRPRGQHHKTAMAASLRAAFPEDCAEYTSEEMEGKTVEAGGVVIDAEPERQSRPEPKQIRQPAKPARARDPVDEDRIPDFDGPPPDESPPPPNGKNARYEIKGWLSQAKNVAEVWAVADTPLYLKVQKEAPKAVKDEVTAMLQEALERVAAQLAEAPPDDGAPPPDMPPDGPPGDMFPGDVVLDALDKAQQEGLQQPQPDAYALCAEIKKNGKTMTLAELNAWMKTRDIDERAGMMNDASLQLVQETLKAVREPLRVKK